MTSKVQDVASYADVLRRRLRPRRKVEEGGGYCVLRKKNGRGGSFVEAPRTSRT